MSYFRVHSVHSCANFLHTYFCSFIRLYSLKKTRVQFVHFFWLAYIYNYYYTYHNCYYILTLCKKLHKVHTLRNLAINECFLPKIACILSAHRVHRLHKLRCVHKVIGHRMERYADLRNHLRSFLYPPPRGLLPGCRRSSSERRS